MRIKKLSSCLLASRYGHESCSYPHRPRLDTANGRRANTGLALADGWLTTDIPLFPGIHPFSIITHPPFSSDDIDQYAFL